MWKCWLWPKYVLRLLANLAAQPTTEGMCSQCSKWIELSAAALFPINSREFGCFSASFWFALLDHDVFPIATLLIPFSIWQQAFNWWREDPIMAKHTASIFILAFRVSVTLKTVLWTEMEILAQILS